MNTEGLTDKFSTSAQALWRCALDLAALDEEPLSCEYLLAAAASLPQSKAYSQLVTWGAHPLQVLETIAARKRLLPKSSARVEVLPYQEPRIKGVISVAYLQMRTDMVVEITDIMLLQALLRSPGNRAYEILKSFGVMDYFIHRKAVA